MPAFVDTNVVVYALGRDDSRKARARQILDAAPIASSQVINEAISVLMSKQRFGREEAYEVADALMKLVAVAPVTANTSCLIRTSEGMSQRVLPSLRVIVPAARLVT